MTALFFRHGKPGWYASVLKEGRFAAGDKMFLVQRAPENVSVADIWDFSARGRVAPEMIGRIMNLEVLPDFWKERAGRR